MIWLLVGYMWLFIHRPFEIWPVLGTLRVERVYMLCILVCWIVSNPIRPIRNPLHVAIGAFVLAMIASWVLSPYSSAGQTYVENYLKYVVLYVLLVTSIRQVEDLKKIILGHALAMMLFMLHALREYSFGNVWYVQGIMRMRAPGASFSDYNDFAGLIVCSLPFAWTFWGEVTGLWKRGLLVGYFGISAYCIYLTASRMGACGFALAVGFGVAASRRRWRLAAIAIPLFIVAWTLLPEKHQNRYLSVIKPKVANESASASAGNFRVNGFVQGVDLFEQRPAIGFGPGAFGEAIGTGMMAHNMYGQLLAELGALGTLAFALMFVGIVRNTLSMRKSYLPGLRLTDRFCGRVVYAAFSSYVLLLIMGWGFNFLFWHVWAWFAAFQVIAIQCRVTESDGGMLNAGINLVSSPNV